MIKFGESGHPVSVPRVHCREERSKANEVENYQCSSAQEQSQICVMNTESAKQER